MKIKFTKLPTTNGTIKVSLDGGNSFKDYNIADIHKSGIPLDDSQDYEKIQIQAPANVLKNLNVVSSVKVDGEDGGESTNEHSFIMDTDTYGFEFPNCVTGVIIPNGTTTVNQIGLRFFPNLQTIIIPDSVTSIGQSAFYRCTSLTSITIPESVTSIGSGAFSQCSSLTSITIPESVTSIGNSAFSQCSSLTSINIPDSVISIGQCAFSSCKGLTSITISEGVTSIDDSAFSYCTSLKTINYTGTEEQWNAISKDSNWVSNCPSDMVITYNYQG